MVLWKSGPFIKINEGTIINARYVQFVANGKVHFKNGPTIEVNEHEQLDLENFLASQG